MGEALTLMPPNDSAEQVAEIRRLNAWNLRAQGKSYREIGVELGVSHVTAWKDVEAFHQAEADSIREEAKHHIAMALQRNDRVIAVLQPLAEMGDMDAIDRLDKFEKRRAALIGMDAPDRQVIEATVNSAASPIEAARLVRQAFGEHASQKAADEPAKPEDCVSDISTTS